MEPKSSPEHRITYRKKAGQILAEFDKKEIEAQGYNCEIPMVVTNMEMYEMSGEPTYRNYKKGEEIFRLKKKTNV